MGSATIEQLIAQRLADAIVAYEENRNSRNGTQNEASGSAEGAVGLTRWFEKMESVFHIYNCSENCQVKYATCTLLDDALTLWNSYVETIGLDDAYETT
ncbi:hypothetical protein Tco_0831462 [Tanacetum coccineum]